MNLGRPRVSWTQRLPLAVAVILIVFVGVSHFVVYKDRVASAVARTTYPNLLASERTKGPELSVRHIITSHVSNTKTPISTFHKLPRSQKIEHNKDTRKLSVDLNARSPKKYPKVIRQEGIKKMQQVENQLKSRGSKRNFKTETTPLLNLFQYSSTFIPTTTSHIMTSTEATTAKTTSIPKVTDKFVIKLTRELTAKIKKALPYQETLLTASKTCNNATVMGNSCDKKKGCLQLQLPESPQSRIEQLVQPYFFHPSAKYTRIIEDMSNQVPRFYDIVVLTGASSSNYEDSKALLENFKSNFAPHFRNFTMIYYNLGLSNAQRKDLSKVSCPECHIFDFPFSEFPDCVSSLRCRAWKPVMINAHIRHCNVLLWVDSSVRFLHNPSPLKELFRRVRVRGFQGGTNANALPIPYVTSREMFHFFGDEACAYLPYTESMPGITLFLNEPLIKRAIIEPWTACAFDQSCMCLSNAMDPKSTQKKDCFDRKGQYDYGQCHRADQSALGIIVRKLFQEKSEHLFAPNIGDFVEMI